MRRTLFLVVAIGLLAPLHAQTFASRAGSLKAVAIAGPFAFPWAMAWLPDGRLLVTERDGRLDLVTDGKTITVAGVPTVATGGQGGLFDVLVLPKTDDGQELLLSYAWADRDGKSLRVSRFTLTGDDGKSWRLEKQQSLFDLLPRSAGSIQFGGRLALLPDGTLLIATGDRGEMPRAQDFGDGAGKVHRINLAGGVPSDNPFLGKPGYLPTIWTLGHRNIQGLWVDAATGAVWATEHGPMGGDEVNRLLPGRNYGWPIITYGVNYGSGTKIGEGFEKPGMEQPILYWKPSIAPSGLTYYDGDKAPGWKGSFVSGALAGQGLSRFRIGEATQAQTKPDRATLPAHPPAWLLEEEFLPSGTLGRIRDVRTGPDGFLYLTTDSPRGMVYRLDETEH